MAKKYISPYGKNQPGKVKFMMTPRIERTADQSAKLHGHKKFRVKSSENRTYKSGAHRLESSNGFIANSFHKYNTERGITRFETF